jgi:uncharacterized membrane protein YkvA (DUF1232 family)
VWVRLAVAVVAGLAVAEVLFVAVLWRLAPDSASLRASLRLLPDVVRLVSRLARDRTLPIGVRLRLWGLLGYLALPIDLVPDFIPVVGYADDAILVAVTLRSVARAAGVPALAKHWPGTPQGLAVVTRLAGIAEP